MTYCEEFADPVVVPGPNVRSLFVETEEVGDASVEQVCDDSMFCPSCLRPYPADARWCGDDGTGLVELPPPAEV